MNQHAVTLMIAILVLTAINEKVLATEGPTIDSSYLLFSCGGDVNGDGGSAGELVMYLSDRPPWAHFDNRYYKIVSIFEDFVTGLSLNGKELDGTELNTLPGGEILVIQLSTGLLWVSTIRQFMQPYGLGMQAFSFSGKCEKGDS